MNVNSKRSKSNNSNNSSISSYCDKSKSASSCIIIKNYRVVITVGILVKVVT